MWVKVEIKLEIEEESGGYRADGTFQFHAHDAQHACKISDFHLHDNWQQRR